MFTRGVTTVYKRTIVVSQGEFSLEQKSDKNFEYEERVRCTIYMPSDMRDKFDRWAECEGFTTQSGRVNRGMAIRQLISEKCNVD